MEEIERSMVISTGHLSLLTRDSWIPQNQDKLIMFAKGEYGWMIRTVDLDNYDASQIPSDLWNAISYAERYGMHWLVFDRDGPFTDNLPVYQRADGSPSIEELSSKQGSEEEVKEKLIADLDRIPDFQKQMFMHIRLAGAAGNLCLVSCKNTLTEKTVTTLAVVYPLDNNENGIMPLAELADRENTLEIWHLENARVLDRDPETGEISRISQEEYNEKQAERPKEEPDVPSGPSIH